jgi:hypothetical protein
MSTKTIFLGANGIVGDGTEDIGGFPIEVLVDGILQTFTRNTELPLGYTSITSIILRYRRTHAGNLYIKFLTSHTPASSASAVSTDSDSYTAYAGGGTDRVVSNITVPAAAYNGLTSMSYQDIFGITASRDASNASDTYTSDLQILGFVLTLSCTAATSETIYKSKYCNTSTDLYRVYPRIEEFKEQRSVRGWVVHGGSVYKKGNVGFGDTLLENNIIMANAGSIAAITAGKMYYDSATDVLYVQAASGLPTATTNAYLWGTDWDDLKDWAVTHAVDLIDALLDKKFPIPIPESSKASSAQRWDGPLVDATAYMAVSLIAARREPPKFDTQGTATNIPAELQANAERIIGKYNSGDYLFSWEVSTDEIGGCEITADSSNTSTAFLQLRGQYTGSEDATWIIQVVTGGALGTATYKLSVDNGVTFDTAVTTVSTHAWQDLADSIEVQWFDRGGGALSFIADDKWEIEVKPLTTSQNRSKIGSIDLVA